MSRNISGCVKRLDKPYNTGHNIQSEVIMPYMPKTHLQRMKASRPKSKPVVRLGSRSKLYNSARWRRGRRIYLANNPLCIMCYPDPVPATVVDHIIPHRGDYNLFFDESNWQPLCEMHHNQKTGRGE